MSTPCSASTLEGARRGLFLAQSLTVCIDPISRLDRRCRVIAGFDTLDALEKVTVDEKYRPIQDVKINSVVIHANPLADAA